MSLVITKGYLVARYDYNLFDEILVFINQFGNSFTCLALGTRKITSKNARALMFGNYLEIELFYAGTTNKLSKLKKVVAINQIDFNYASNLALLTVSTVISKLPQTNKRWFTFYQDVLAKVLMDYDKYQLSVYVYLYFIVNVFNKIKIYKCCHYSPGTNLEWTYSFVDSGLVCPLCHSQNFSLNKQELQLLLSVEKLNFQDESFFNKTYNINWQTLYEKMFYSYNAYLKKINELYRKK